MTPEDHIRQKVDRFFAEYLATVARLAARLHAQETLLILLADKAGIEEPVAREMLREIEDDQTTERLISLEDRDSAIAALASIFSEGSGQSRQESSDPPR
jgi:hypothetical protein